MGIKEKNFCAEIFFTKGNSCRFDIFLALITFLCNTDDTIFLIFQNAYTYKLLLDSIFLINNHQGGEMSGLTGISLPKDSYAVEFDSHRGRILLQFIIISNNVMSE